MLRQSFHSIRRNTSLRVCASTLTSTSHGRKQLSSLALPLPLPPVSSSHHTLSTTAISSLSSLSLYRSNESIKASSQHTSTLSSSFTGRSYHTNDHQQYSHQQQHSSSRSSSSSNNSRSSSYLFGIVGAAGSTAAVLYVTSDLLTSNTVYAQSHVDVNDASTGALSSPSMKASAVVGTPSDIIRQQQLLAIDTLSSGDIIISPRWRRVLAGVIDSLVISAMSSVISLIFVNQWSPLQVPLMAIGNIIYECGSHLYFNGQTLGKWMMSIRIVKEDGTPMDVQAATILYVTKLLNILFLSDYLWGLFNIHGDYKCLHNVFSKTVVALEK